MGIADDILRKGFKTLPTKPATPPSVADAVLAESGEANKIAADRQPAIGTLEPASTRRNQIVHVDNFAELAADLAAQGTVVSGTVNIGNFPATQPISATSLPLPTGAATAALQGTTIADAPVGTETASITRDIFRKKSSLLTNTPLGANGVFTSAWFDTELTGTRYIDVLSIANVNNLATTGLLIVQSEDQVNTFNIGAQGATTQCRVGGVVRMRYYRIIFTNGAVAQATFSLYVTESSLPYAGDAVGNNTPEIIVVGTTSNAAGVAGDGVNNQSVTGFANTSGSGGFQRNMCYLFNGSTWDRPRTPTIFKQVSTAATGSTALWTPTAGKKFRIMRFRVTVTGLAKAAAAADLTIDLLDAAATIGLKTLVTIQTTALTLGGDQYDSGWIDLGNGILSALANNVLNLNLSFALTGGLVSVNVCGTEE